MNAMNAMKKDIVGWFIGAGAGAMAIALALPGSEARAQAVPAPNATASLEPIVVTAQRREENLQTVPVAVTVFSESQLQQHQIADIGTLTTVVPNMMFGPGYDPTDIVIGIRGISETIPTLGVDPAVGVYVDGIYYDLTQGVNTGFVDMERVEVLRGPQGTLFGRNTIGGALNITTNKPTDSLTGSATVTYGNYNDKEATGVINLPISDQLATRLVYQHVQHDGYAYDAFLKQPLDDGKQNYVRDTIAYHPNNAWSFIFSGDYFKYTSHSTMQKMDYYNTNDGGLNAYLPYAAGHPGDLLTNYLGGNFYTNYAGINPLTSVKKYSFTNTIAGELNDDITLKFLTGYANLDRHEGTDIDGSPYGVIDIIAAPLNASQFSQEVQLLGDAADKRLKWIGGLYYFQLSGRQTDVLNFFEPIGIQNYLQQSTQNHSYAAYGQLTYEIVSALRLTGGVRYTKDDRTAENYDHANSYAGAFAYCEMSLVVPAVTPADCHLSGKASFSYWPWTIGVEYEANQNVFLYAKVSKSFRSGGFAQSAPEPPAAPVSTLPYFNPENVLSYEVGSKLELFDHALRFNTALFRASYNDIQQTFNIATSTGTVSVTQNVGEARYLGAEFEVSALIEKLSLNASLGLIDPEFTNGPEFSPIKYPVTNVSRKTFALSASYPVELGFGRLTVTGDYDWRSRMYYFAPVLGAQAQKISDPAAESASVAQNDFGLFNARADLKLTGYPLTLSLWGRNLTDQQYRARVTSLVQGGLPLNSYIAGIPRIFGISVKWDF
jgi:iron complex outermembrane receptor protein